ncbi:MAG: PAQR family membrane homeostasis protein TrhA [bacterium]
MRVQTKTEEFWNTATHALGAILGVVGLVLLIIKSDHEQSWSLLSVLIYGISVITLFTSSTLYHAFTDEKKKHFFRILDHINIYFLIAGSYTPVLLLLLIESKGIPLLCAVWGIALFGLILKLFFTGKFEIFSTLLYLIMGWLIVFDFSALKVTLTEGGVWLLYAGGISYTVGILFYVIEKIPFNHVIWHLFVLAGAIFHFFMIYDYVI